MINRFTVEAWVLRLFLILSQSYSTTRMYTYTETLRLNCPYSLQLTVLSHGWRNLAPYDWIEERKTLTRRDNVPIKDIPLFFEITSTGKSAITLTVTAPNTLESADLHVCTSGIRRALCLENTRDEFSEMAKTIDPDLATFIDMGGGRLLRGTTLFEDIVKTLLTTNTTWSSTQRMVLNLVNTYGKNGSFPLPIDFQSCSDAQLRKTCKLGYRSRYLLQLLDQFSDHPCGDMPCIPEKIMGLGEYGMAHIRMLNEDFSTIPIDSGVRAYCLQQYGSQHDGEINDTFAEWGKYKCLAYTIERQVSRRN